MKTTDDVHIDGVVSDELVEQIAHAHSENPAARTIQPFLNHLEYLDNVTLDDAKFMIEASRENPITIRLRSVRMLIGILKTFGRLKLHSRWTNLWQAIEHDMDCTFAAFISSQSLTIRSEFVEGHKDALQPLLPWLHIQKVEAALNAKPPCDPPLDSLEQLLTSATGATLYKDQGAKLKYIKYLHSVGKRFVDLENLYFTEEDVTSFKSIMKLEGRRVLSGVPGFAEKTSAVPFLGKILKVSLLSTNDEWAFRLEGRMRSIAVATAQLTRLPWEIALWGKKEKVDGYPTTIHIPHPLIMIAENGRMACTRMFSSFDTDNMTFDEMKKTLGEKQEEELIALDRFSKMDMKFLRGHAEEVAFDMITQAVLACLPSESDFHDYTFATTLRAPENVRISRLATAVGPRIDKDLSGISLMLSKMEKGAGPSAGAVAKMNPFVEAGCGPL